MNVVTYNEDGVFEFITTILLLSLHKRLFHF